jgi:ABC-type glutathione transport system ATPase component
LAANERRASYARKVGTAQGSLFMAFRFEGVTKIFRSSPEDVVALRDVSFAVEDEQFACIVGPSGCGKTTLLRMLARRALPPTLPSPAC